MDQQPGICASCHSQPANEDGVPKPAVLAVGVDINWGDSLYLCEECVFVAGELLGMLRAEKAEELKTRNKFLEKQNKKLQKKLEKAKTIARDVIAGKKAEKELANES
jgi:hypothetical protein